MDLQTKMENFNKRWNIEDNESNEEKFTKFENRVMNNFEQIDSYISDSSISHFCNALGIKEIWTEGPFGNVYGYNIINTLKHEKDFVKYFRTIEIIFSLDFKNKNEKKGERQKEILYLLMKKAFAYSNINARLEKIEDEIFVLPVGEKLLDEEIVDHVLSFLDNDALSHFSAALKDYEKNTETDRVGSVDHLRRSLEEQLRKELENHKGLQKNIPELGKKLKSMQVNNDVKNIIVSILNSLDKLFNENSKHKDGIISEPENEYLIYQVALLMRYVHNVIIQD